jgi:sensor histidine kinase YesM
MQELKELLNPRYRLLSHILFWVSYTIFSLISANTANDSYSRSFVLVTSTLPVKIFAVYFSLYVLIPRFLDTKKYATLAILFLLSAVCFGYLNRWALHLYYVPAFRPDYNYQEYPLSHFGKAIQNAFPVATVVFAAIVIKLIKRNYQQEKLAQDLAKEKLDAELKFLKGQIHPHFLFNTLNNLSPITLQDSPRASEVVLKLSNLLDYMLYEANVSQVSLRKELLQMHNLVELEKLRYGDRLAVTFTSRGEIANKSLPPLLILPFV